MHHRHMHCPAPRLVRVATIFLAAVVAALAAAGTAWATPNTDRWAPPSPQRSASFETTDITWSDGAVTTAVWPAARLPVALSVEQELIDAVGLDRVRRGVQGWNGIAGSRFAATVVATVTDGVSGPRKDGINRLFVDRETCKGEEAGWAHILTIEGDRAHGAAGGYVAEADIGVCPRVLSRPDTVEDTIRHEMGHLLGLGHLSDPCRVMAARSDVCQRFNEHDRQAVRHLYPTLPRLAGPSRLETSARVVYATRPNARSAPTVVLVDAHGTSVLPVVAAALAGAMDAPLLLVDPAACLNGPAGVELNRVAAGTATVLLVGATDRCTDDIRSRGWTPVLLADVRDVADEFTRRRAPDTVMVVRGPHTDGNLPDGLTAAAAAAGLDAPILLADDDRVTGDLGRFLEENGQVRRAVIVGGEQAVSGRVAAELESRGLRVERRAGTDRIGTALAVADTLGAFPTGGPVLIAAANKWADTVSGSALGGAEGWPVLLTWPDQLDGRVADRLSATATGGYVLGGTAAVSNAAHLQAGVHVK